MASRGRRVQSEPTWRCFLFLLQEAERRGVSAEEVYAAICMCGGSNTDPCDWLTSELPHLLDEICAMAASVQVERDGEEAEPRGVKLSRAEAKTAWLAARGDTERAVRQMLRDRQVKVGPQVV